LRQFKGRRGWDVVILEDGEPLFSRRCADEKGPRYVAESVKQDLLRTGWTLTDTIPQTDLFQTFGTRETGVEVVPENPCASLDPLASQP
jgi:hypothetical protein